MKIGIELRQPVLGASGGLALLLKGMLETLFVRFPATTFIVFCTHLNADLIAPPPNVRLLRLPTQRFFADIDRVAHAEQIDVLFRSFPMQDSLAFPLARQIFLLPDLQHELLPEFFTPADLRGRRLAFNRALAQAGAVATLSEHARQTLRDHAWTLCEDIFLVTPAPMPPARARLTAREQALLPQGDFLLYPANLWPHKNHRRLLAAFQQFLARGAAPVELILTGHPAGWPALAAEFGELPVRHLGFVSPQLLQALLRRARALAFFSLFEGFGMPLLDAFAAGTPVICSNTTSLPEVAGDAALMCDPTDTAAIAGLIARILADAPLRAELAAHGRRQAERFSWAGAADALHAACVRVAAAPPPHPSITELPLVSIITPSYNQGRFIGRTIESVLAQSYPRIEYIVVDGGSTDATVALLQSYGDRFAWVSEPDGGQTDAINKGLARARGSICAYLNSDDVLLPDAVAAVVRYLQAHPDCDMVYGRAQYIDADDAVIGMYRTADYSFERLMYENCICQPAAFWRQRIAAKIGPFDAQLHYAMDYDYWLRIDRAGGRIEHMPDMLAASRVYPETKTNSARAAIFAEIIQICMRRAGYVDRNYFYGQWTYWCFEHPSGWPRRFRRVPKFAQIMARLHYRWYHRRQYTPRYFARAIVRRARRSRRLISLYALTEPAGYRLRRLGAGLLRGCTQWLTDRARRAKPRSHIL